MATAAVGDSASTEAIRLQLDRILKSRVFCQSIRLCKFLQFTVEYTIAGKADLLKEYLIGCEVYDRRPPYDPTQDSIVRTEARRLRSKLRQYYETEGKHDLVRIQLDVGRYVPSFIQSASIEEMESLAAAVGSELALGTRTIPIGVESSRDLAQTALPAALAEKLSEGIAHVLMRGMCAVNIGSPRQDPDHPPPKESTSLCPDFRFEGSIREVEGGLSVLMRLIRADSMRVA